MTQKSILITGCSTGIGRYAAFELQKRGYLVVATCRAMLDVGKLQAEGLQHVLPLDLRCSDSIQAAVEATLNITGGSLYALFNNGAYGQPGAVEDLKREVLHAQFDTNVFGTHELTCRLIPTFAQQPAARIIQNSSVLGFVGMPGRGAYNASKFALEGLSDTMRLELRDTNVKVVLIEPGPIESAFRKNALAALETNINVEASRHQAHYKAAIKRLSTVGPAVPFTLGPEAVFDKVWRALESSRPKARYYVTFPTYLLGYCKRILPTSWFDFLVKASSG